MGYINKRKEEKHVQDMNRAGKELIQLASTLSRNKAEFEVLAERLYDPTLPEPAIEGILDEMEAHLKGASKERTEDVYQDFK